ncbi:DUF305 domain-containing protein [Sporichthya polymorpha]|uniref:DUF305 domain-containing protein n=1 Tax=Sporichthya polymorpha TaxID=35751 RepID=UPI00035E891C|nr:DUF305 domain-containing protein [Sporichthya polymorpha]
MTNRFVRSAALALATVASAALLAGCGGGDDATSQPAAAAAFNTADVTFAQGMLPHHVQAVEMARLAKSRAASAEVKKLAATILSGQEPEIEQLRQLLAQWGRSLDKSMETMTGMESMRGMPGMETMEGMSNLEATMDGMATSGEMAELRAAKGAKFDRLFLTMMIEHHRGALQMAKAERADGKAPEALTLAEQIEIAQQGEIQKMQKLKNG